MSEVSVLYSEVKVTYEERRNVWTFSLRGRERTADSLAKAKEAIDKVPKDKNTFQRVPVYCYDGYSTTIFIQGEITSIAEGRYSTPEVWIVAKGERKKVYASTVFPITDHNSPLVEQLQEMREEINALEAKYKAAKSKLAPYVIANQEEEIAS